MPPNFHNYKIEAVRSAAILTNSYVAGTVLENLQANNQLVLLVDFTIGSLTSLEIKVEFSPDNVTFYQEVGADFSSGTSTLSLNEYTITSTAALRLPIALKDRFVRISVKGTGTVTSSTVTVDAIVGNSN